MTRFEVWAPIPSRVRVVVADETHELRREGEWWSADIACPPDARYAYLLDDSDERRPGSGIAPPTRRRPRPSQLYDQDDVRLDR